MFHQIILKCSLNIGKSSIGIVAVTLYLHISYKYKYYTWSSEICEDTTKNMKLINDKIDKLNKKGEKDKIKFSVYIEKIDKSIKSENIYTKVSKMSNDEMWK